MQIQYMWGKNREYGLFSADENGYPNAGEVVRCYRVLRKLSATKFGELYGKALGENPKSRIWVLAMERKNDVPTDINRRRAIANLLGIPYALLGISEILAKKPLKVDTLQKPMMLPKRETLAQEVLAEHQQSLALYFAGYYHRRGQTTFDDVTTITETIDRLVTDSRQGSTHTTGLTLASMYHQFAVNIAREQQSYPLALSHASKAVTRAQEVNKLKPSPDLLAIAMYRYGVTQFEQSITQGKGVEQAQLYLDAAVKHAENASPLVKGFISLEWGLVHSSTARSEDDKKEVLKQLDEGYSYVSEYNTHDDRFFLKFSSSWYHLARAEALIALGRYAEAIGELELAEEETPLTLPRRFAYIDALRAKAYMGLGEPDEAVTYAKDALVQSKAVKSEFNIARIAQVYRQLKEDNRHFSNVTELEKELTKTHPHLVLA